MVLARVMVLACVMKLYCDIDIDMKFLRNIDIDKGIIKISLK